MTSTRNARILMGLMSQVIVSDARFRFDSGFCDKIIAGYNLLHPAEI